jgi:hypothetical protein
MVGGRGSFELVLGFDLLSWAQHVFIIPHDDLCRQLAFDPKIRRGMTEVSRHRQQVEWSGGWWHCAMQLRITWMQEHCECDQDDPYEEEELLQQQRRQHQEHDEL